MSSPGAVGVFALGLALVIAPGPAPRADDVPAPLPAPDPTARDDRATDTAAQREARALFATGNAHFEHNEFVRAVEAYRAALVRWDRPIIHFNLAVALIELDRAREAVVHLDRAIAPGFDELGPRVVEARNYLRLLRARLATLTIHCAATACDLDGHLVARAAIPILLEAGTHTVVGRKPGFETSTRTIVLEPGTTRVITVAAGGPRVRVARRWSPAGPWIASGTGVIVTVAGGATLLLGNQAMAGVNRDLRARCPTACLGIPADLAGRAGDARFAQRAGTAGIVVGSAALVTGLVLSYLNQPRLVGAAARPRLGFVVGERGVVVSVSGAL